MVAIFHYKASFNSMFEEVDAEVNKIMSRLGEKDIFLDNRLKFIIEFALRELFNNAVEHGNKMDRDKKVSYCIALSSDKLEIEISDCGEGFDINSMVTLQNDSPIRQRNRGLPALLDLGFAIVSDHNKTSSSLNISKNIRLESMKE